MIRPKTWIAAAIATTLFHGPLAEARPGTSSTAHADGKNEIRAVTYDEDAGTTRIRVRGAQTPTFTVYKLERPSRIVIDVPQARLAEAMRGHESATVLTAGTWAVNTIAAQQLDDGGQLVRVIVTLARPGRYDVKTDGNAVVVMVTARDAAPKTTNPAELAQAQAEREQARRAAEVAEQARAAAERSSVAAQAEAERLRKLAAEHSARADAAQRAAEDAKRAGQRANQTELAKAKADADRAKADADKARQAAAAAQGEADRARVAAEHARREALAEAERARKEAELAKQDVVKSRAEVERAKQAVASSRAEAERAKQQAAREAEAAARTLAQAEAARKQAEAAARSLAEAEQAKLAAVREAEAAKAAAAREANAAKQAAAREASAAKQAAARDAEAARIAAAREAEAARQDLAKIKAEAEAARREVARTKAEAQAAQAMAAKELDAATRAKADADRARRDAEAAKHDVATTKDVVARTQAEADRARREAAQAKDALAQIRAEADAAKQDAARVRADAEAAKIAAAADRKRAEAARADADRMLRDARQQLATLDKKAQSVQALEDQARAASAAAQAREEAARAEVARAAKEREAAEAAAKAAGDRAAIAATKSSSQAASLSAEARAAEARLASARRAIADAEARRLAAESAATSAKQQLEQTRKLLVTVEDQRTAAETAANEAARKRGEAEAAASDATRRRSEAEIAAAQAAAKRREAEAAAQTAAKQRTEAEQSRIAAELSRKVAEDAARTAREAAAAAEQQRVVAETAARTATAKRAQAESSLAELTTRRLAAERAAALLEQRSKAEAKAKAQIAAAQARKASEDELATARAEATRLARERSAAERDLAERRKAVATQQAETTRLEAAAAQARHAADREEARRATLATLRAAEEQELARLKAQKAAPAPKPVVAQAAPAKPTTPPATVSDIRFTGNDGGGQVDIAMTGGAVVTVGAVTATTAELIIDHAALGAKLERKLDVTRFGSPVRAVSSFRDRKHPNRVRLVAELAQPVKPVLDRDASGARWRFVPDGHVAKRPARTQHVQPPVVAGFGAVSTPVTQQSVAQLPAQGGRRRVYRGATIDFDFKDAPIHDLLRIIADTGRVNIVVPDDIDAKVTVRLKRVPWDQALEVILASHGLWYRREGNLYRIAPRSELDKEDEAEAARREAMVKAESPQPQVVPLNYANADELRPKLEAMLSPKGRIEVDPRTNALIINDVAANRRQINDLALLLDTQTPQISIEARIVEARSTFVRQFGIQWGGRALAGAAGGNATGLVFPSSISLVGGNEDAQTVRAGVASPSDFAVNLPAATGSGEGGAIGLSLGSVGGNLNINLRLSALEDTGTVRIISAPKITVLNNKAAKISQGVSIPISVISAAGTQTQFVQADLSLEVTPYVSQRDCAIAMNLKVTKNEPDFVNTGARGDPTILRKEASTSMLVADGETSVLGGIYTRNSGLAYRKIPFLADIPVFGWLFKNRRENDDRTEILVFITPKITNRALLRCQ